MNRTAFHALSRRAQELASNYLSEDHETRKKALNTLAHSSGKMLAITIRYVQIQSGHKANEVVRNLCDTLGNVD